MAADPLEPATTLPEAASKQENERLAAELAATRAALEESERRLRELRERRSAEMERLERQAYWLEWAGIDFDRLMARRGPRIVLEALRRIARSLVRAVRRLRG
jgi:hypothetical protein